MNVLVIDIGGTHVKVLATGRDAHREFDSGPALTPKRMVSGVRKLVAVKQKLPENNGGYVALNSGGVSYGKFDDRIYSELASDHPIDLCRYQVANCYMGRAGLINSGGASGKNDLGEAVVTAVINKRAGGTGLISGRKAFQRPVKEGIELLNAIQDVYLAREVTIA